MCECVDYKTRVFLIQILFEKHERICVQYEPLPKEQKFKLVSNRQLNEAAFAGSWCWSVFCILLLPHNGCNITVSSHHIARQEAWYWTILQNPRNIEREYVLVAWLCRLVCISITIQWIAVNFMQTFMVPRRLILMTLVIPWPPAPQWGQCFNLV